MFFRLWSYLRYAILYTNPSFPFSIFVFMRRQDRFALSLHLAAWEPFLHFLFLRAYFSSSRVFSHDYDTFSFLISLFSSRSCEIYFFFSLSHYQTFYVMWYLLLSSTQINARDIVIFWCMMSLYSNLYIFLFLFLSLFFDRFLWSVFHGFFFLYGVFLYLFCVSTSITMHFSLFHSFTQQRINIRCVLAYSLIIHQKKQGGNPKTKHKIHEFDRT